MWDWCGVPGASRSTHCFARDPLPAMDWFCDHHTWARSILVQVAFMQSGALCLGLDSTETKWLLP